VYCGTSSVKILKWLVSPGDEVDKDQPIVEVQADYYGGLIGALWIDMQLTAPITGKILHTHGQNGEDLPVPSVLVTYAVEHDEPSATDKEGIARQVTALVRRLAEATGIEARARGTVWCGSG
jgi:pyruvate dehydrogenase E2 component (dihydrolipoamide acetyltransferase)